MRASAYIKALPFLIKKQAENELYNIYVTDALRMICENTANFVGGRYPNERYAALILPQKQETRTEEEIIAHVRKRGWGVKE